jgi:hypothetical protein
MSTAIAMQTRASIPSSVGLPFVLSLRVGQETVENCAASSEAPSTVRMQIGSYGRGNTGPPRIALRVENTVR